VIDDFVGTAACCCCPLLLLRLRLVVIADAAVVGFGTISISAVDLLSLLVVMLLLEDENDADEEAVDDDEDVRLRRERVFCGEFRFGFSVVQSLLTAAAVVAVEEEEEDEEDGAVSRLTESRAFFIVDELLPLDRLRRVVYELGCSVSSVRDLLDGGLCCSELDRRRRLAASGFVC
jgi:hypothetical protein